jgi:two-component system NtrC family sensor kinase
MDSRGSDIRRVLHEAEAGLRALVDNVPLILFVIDAEGVVTFAAGQGLEAMGLSSAAVVGRSAYDFYPERSRIREGIRQALAGETFSTTGPAGDRWFDVQLSPIWKQEQVTGAMGIAIDVTARRQAETALQQEQGWARTYLDVAEVILVALNTRGEVALVNRKGCRVLGYEEHELLGRNWFATCLRPQDRERIAGFFQQMIAGEGEPFAYFENHVRTKSGEERLIAWQNAYLRDAAGCIVGLLSSGEDITERRHSERALQESEARFRHTFDQSPIGAAIVSLEGRFMRANAAFCRFLGYTEEELTQRRFADITHPDHLATDLEQVRRLHNGEIAEYVTDKRYLCKDGSVVWGHLSVGLVRDAAGRPMYTLPIVEDITARKQAEEELRQLYLTEQKRRRIAETLRQASMVFGSTLDLDEVLERILQQLREVIPCNSASLQRLQKGLLKIIAAHGFAEIKAVIGLTFPLDGKFPNLRVVETKSPLALADVGNDYPHFHTEEVVYSSGHIRSWLGVPLLIKDQVIGMITIDRSEVQPFTAEETALAQTFAGQAAIAIENARLYDDLQQQMKQLQTAQLQLVQSAKLAAVGELAAGVAHELNNPLTSILGFAELLAAKRGLSPEVRQDLDTITSEAYRARDIVRGLLDFARQTKPMRTRTDVNLLLRQTLAVMRRHLEDSGIAVVDEYAPDLGFLFLDESKMKQVALNLITNAAHAMPNGGTLRVSTFRTDDEVTIMIADTGEGISPENLERIFDPFFTTKPIGTGLGLAVSLGIVQEHGGRIAVESVLGQGSTFTIKLPHALSGKG